MSRNVVPNHRKLMAAADAGWPDRLLAWYQIHRRALPWRDRKDAYAVWISEIMLQQTQVETAIPYYRRFLERFPDVKTLAAASLDRVLKTWQGLGYYRRARDLHRAAQTLCLAGAAGRIPESFAALRRLPGCGDYTAAAIASIAFEEPVPAIDGNVLRVMARVLAVGHPIQTAAARKPIAPVLTAVLGRVQPSAFNQALMELGALICRPIRPACEACPLAPDCRAHRTGRTDRFPVRQSGKPIPHQRVVVALIRRADGRLLITRRPEDRMFGGMWEFPGGKTRRGESLTRALQREMREELGIVVRITGRRHAVRQTYSHFRVTVTPYDCLIAEGTPRPLAATGLRWVTVSALKRYAFPRATQRIIDTLET